MLIRFKPLYVLAIFAALTACSKKPLKYEKSVELGTIKEYEELITIKELPAPTPGAALVAETPSATPAPTPEPTPIKKEKKKPKQVKAPTPAPEAASTRRQPDIEDAEGFEGRRPILDPFRVGEKVVLMVTYFGVSAGDMAMMVKPFVEVNGRKSYRFEVTIKSSDIFSMFYSVDDGAETFLDFENLIPYTFSVHATESKQLLEVRTFFDWKNLKASRWQRRVTEEEGVKEKKVEWELLPFSQNIFSSAFYLRTFTLTPGKTVEFRVADEGKNYVVKGEVLRRETLSTALGDLKTVVVRPTVAINGIFQPMGAVNFWLTDDDRKFFVKIEAEIKIGKIVSFLKSIDRGAP